MSSNHTKNRKRTRIIFTSLHTFRPLESRDSKSITISILFISCLAIEAEILAKNNILSLIRLLENYVVCFKTISEIWNDRHAKRCSK